MILVAGGSGRLGRRVVAALTARGETVRVLTRDPGRTRDLLGPEVEVVRGDVRDREAVAAAAAGATAVVSAVHGLLGGVGAGPDQVDRVGNGRLAEAARRGGATFVLVSAIGADDRSPLDLFRAKRAAEQQLTGTNWVVVRAGPFLETWIEVLRASAGRSGRPLVLGRGERLLPLVSVGDVAAVVTHATVDASLHGCVLEVAGAGTSMTALATAVQRRDGGAGSPRHLPRAVLRLTAGVTGPVRPVVARMGRAALVLDTTDLGGGDTGLRDRLGLPPATTLEEVLSAPVGT